jgi:hypothetical protein
VKSWKISSVTVTLLKQIRVRGSYKDGTFEKIVAGVQLPHAYLSEVPNNILGLDIITRLRKFHILSESEAYFDLRPGALLEP